MNPKINSQPKSSNEPRSKESETQNAKTLTPKFPISETLNRDHQDPQTTKNKDKRKPQNPKVASHTQFPFTMNRRACHRKNVPTSQVEPERKKKKKKKKKRATSLHHEPKMERRKRKVPPLSTSLHTKPRNPTKLISFPREKQNIGDSMRVL